MTTTARSQPKIEWFTERAEHYDDRFLNAYLNNDWHSDIAFYIPKEDRLVPAHSLIIAAASPVLERFCYGSDELIGTKVINIPENFDFNEFEVILNYLYQGGQNKPSFLSIDATKIYLLADYFELSGLMEMCMKHLTETLSPDNVCSRYDYLHNIDHPFSESCLEIMQAYTLEILENGSAMEMSDDSLATLLDKDRLNINCETDLVGPMLKWAEDSCKKQQLEPTVLNLRKMVETRLGLIRFPTMKIDEFGEHAINTGLLNDMEICSLMRHKYGGSENLPPFTIGSRTVSVVPRTFKKCIRKAKTYQVGYEKINFKTSLVKETIETPFPNKKAWLTGIKFCSEHLNSINIFDSKNKKIIHKYNKGDSRKVTFAERLELSHLTNGNWRLAFQSIDKNPLNIPAWQTLFEKNDSLIRNEQFTCLHSVTIDYETNDA